MTSTLILTAIGALLFDTAFVVFIYMHIKRQGNPGHPSPPGLWLTMALVSLVLGFVGTMKVVELASFMMRR